MQRRPTALTLAATALAVAVLTGCGDDDEVPSENGPVPDTRQEGVPTEPLVEGETPADTVPLESED